MSLLQLVKHWISLCVTAGESCSDKAPVFAQMSILTKVRSETPGDEIVGPSPLHLPVGADG